jgi:protein involved in polysaccharide export with SLBB domain
MNALSPARLLLCAALTSIPLHAAWGQTQAHASTESEQGALGDPLAPGDAIQLAFWREPQLGGDFPVDESGTVVLPLLGVRTVTQRSPAELKRTLLAEYAQQVRNQEVRITLLRRVRILGAVKNPGLYRVDPTMTVVDALALAGGATDQGKLKGIQIYRNGQRVDSHLDLNAELLQQVRSGDQIVVPQRSWFSRNGGYVVAAGISAVGIIIARAAP